MVDDGAEETCNLKVRLLTLISDVLETTQSHNHICGVIYLKVIKAWFIIRGNVQFNSFSGETNAI